MPQKLVPSVKALADEWNDDTMPILFAQMFPKEFSDMEQKISEKNKKGQSVIVTLLASFIKPLVADLLKYINVQELYDGLVDIAKYIGADELVKDDIKSIYKYTPKRLSAENTKILTTKDTNDTKPKKQNKPKPSSPKLDIQKELEDSRRMISELTTSYHDIKKQNRPMQTADKKYVYGLEDIDEDVYVPSEENIFKSSNSKVVYGSPDMSPLIFSFTQPALRMFEALKPQPSVFPRIKEQVRWIDVIEPVISPLRKPFISTVPKLPKFSEITAKELREKLKALGLASSGAKDKLYGRYQMALGNEKQYEKRVPGEDFTNYKKIPVKDLKEILIGAGLSPKGKKDELVARVKAYRAA